MYRLLIFANMKASLLKEKTETTYVYRALRNIHCQEYHTSFCRDWLGSRILRT